MSNSSKLFSLLKLFKFLKNWTLQFKMNRTTNTLANAKIIVHMYICTYKVIKTVVMNVVCSKNLFFTNEIEMKLYKTISELHYI